MDGAPGRLWLMGESNCKNNSNRKSKGKSWLGK